MLVLSRGALLATTATAAAGLLAGPGVAHAADTSTPLTAAEMATELKAVGAASAKASADGWKGTVKISGVSGSEFFAVDPAGGAAYARYDFGGRAAAYYVVAGKGMYASLDAEGRAAVKMMGRPSVRYVFSADKTVKLEDGVFDGVSPASMLTDDVDHAGTKTVHDDGSTDYLISQDKDTMTAHVTAAGVLASVTGDSDEIHLTYTYAYGPQRVTPPPASVTIGDAALDKGLAYLEMATSVKRVAGEAATDALTAAHGHNVSLSSLRNVTRHDADDFNADNGVNMVKTKNVRGGVRVYATNPWTHRTVAYTLQPAGRKVTIAKS